MLVNPEDLELVRAADGELKATLGGIGELDVQAERRVARGGAIVRTATAEVDGRLETQLERAREALLEARAVDARTRCERAADARPRARRARRRRPAGAPRHASATSSASSSRPPACRRRSASCATSTPAARREPIPAEVVGFRDGATLLMPLGALEGIGPGSAVTATGGELRVEVGDELLGRVVDGLGRPIDGGPSLEEAVAAHRRPPTRPIR